MQFLFRARAQQFVLPCLLFIGLLCATSFGQTAKLVGQLNPFPKHNRYGDVWGEGNFAYLASYAGSGVMIIDITNPAAPVLAGFYDPENGAQFKDVVVIDGIGYCSSDDGRGLYIADFKDPKNPRTLSHITPTENGFPSVHELYVSDGLLFEADSRRPTDGLPPRVKVFEVSNPAQPKFLRDVFTTDTIFIHNMFALQGRLYTSGWSGRTDIFDIRNIRTQDPPLLGTALSGGASHSSWVSNDGKLLVSCRETTNGDIQLFDISNPNSPQRLTTINAQTIGLNWERDAFTPHNPVIVGNLLFVSWYQAGTALFDISNPAQPELVARYDTFPGPVACPIDCYGGNWGVYPLLGLDRVLLSDLDNGLLIVDFSAAGKGPKTLSAASFSPAAVAPKAIVAAFGANLANTTALATTQPLPTELAGVAVRVVDFGGTERSAPLFFVSPTQINYQIPAGTKPGPALLKFSFNGQTTLGATTVQAAAPALFTVNQTGTGAAVALDAFAFTTGPFAAVRPNGIPNSLALFGTGFGNEATDADTDVKESVVLTLDGNPVTVTFAGRVPGLTGLNQLNFTLPSGISAGEHRLKVRRLGFTSNEVSITIRL